MIEKFLSKITKMYNNNTNEQDVVIEQIKLVDNTIMTKKYLKKQFLGEGSFAQCYKCIDMQNNKTYALKIIDFTKYKAQNRQMSAKQNLKMQQFIKSQLNIQKTLSHANIVKIDHFFKHDNQIFILMELCQKVNLKDYAQKCKRIPTKLIQNIIKGILEGLKYLHSNKIIHRDLKMGNIFFDEKYNPKIGDFGLAAKLTFNEQTKREVVGTPNYIAPQIVLKIGYQYKVDIWSVGVLLYYLCFKQMPFKGDSKEEIFQNIIKLNYQFPEKDHVPGEAVALIESILVLDPDERPSLDEILQSNFFKIDYSHEKSYQKSQQQTKKQNNQTNFFNQYNQKAFNEPAKKKNSFFEAKHATSKCIIGSPESSLTYVEKIDLTKNNCYVYKLNTGEKGIFYPDGRNLIRDQNGLLKTYTKLSSCQTPKFQSNFNLFNPNTPAYKKESNKTFIVKIILCDGIYLINLSNDTLELLFSSNSGYLFTKELEIYKFQRKQHDDQIPVKITEEKLLEIENALVSPKEIKYAQMMYYQLKKQKKL